ncbi:uncharacterized protein LOC133895776 [Phragmites australis]|uniref:uncharacterized protein LOC133895776 n=1 Tax=Phragmites australis TaxID=29695 RepID=UPI002D79E3E5|nr:uncharacterized protein LOC133895776 [Phragmites australis]
MFDEDDGVDPQFEDVNEYYFEDGEEKPICFNILPFQFGENNEVADYDIENVYLRGFADKSLHIYRKVVGWSLRLDLEQPNIYVLSSEHKWIRLLKPRKCYEKFVRSILITVQMIHFVRKRDKRSCWRHLWDHLHEVFDKYDTEPVLDDLIKHQPLIKLFIERDQTLMESKIIQRFIKNNFKKINKPILKTMGTKAQVFISDERCASKNDDDNDYNEVDSDDDSSGDDTNDDDGTDQICAICDDGGDLLSCEGSCKRSFHPTMEDGRESKCETLGYTSAQVKRIDIYLCENCKYKQHQCFKCGELGPSDGPNAKVFQCNNASCGHFYHPKCIAQLLEPDATDGACELERRILAGMSFTCPIHWCFKCKHMEDKTQRALKLAVCRRCPMAYHRDCLPREFSLNTKDNNVNKRAWKLSGTLLIYCLNHKIDKATGTARRNHIKFPAIPEGSKSRDLGKNEDRMTGKRRNNTDQSSTKSTKTNRLFIEESKKTHSVVVNNSSLCIVLESQCAAKRLKEDLQFGPSMVGTAVVDSLSEHMVLNPVRTTKCLKEDLQFEPSVVGDDSSLSGLEAVKGQEKQFGTSPFVTGTRVRMSSSCVVGRQAEDRVTSKDNKETSSGRSHDIARKRVMPSTKGIYGPSVQDILPENSLVDKNAEWDRTKGDKYVSERDKTSEHYSGEESGAPNKDTSHENHEQNAVLDNLFVEKHAEEDGSKLKSGKGMGMERGENAYGHNSISGQTEEISRRENRIGKSTCEQDSRSEKRKIARNYSKSGSGNGVVTLDNIDDHPTEKQLHVVRVDKATIANRTDTQSEYGCGEDREVNESYACQEKQNSSQCNDNPKVIEIDTVGEKLRKRIEHKEKATGINKADLDNNRKYNQIDGKEARYEDKVLDCRLKSSGHNGPQSNDENAAGETSKYKSRERT